MPFVADAAGKVTASPKTGKITSARRSSGSSVASGANVAIGATTAQEAPQVDLAPIVRQVARSANKVARSANTSRTLAPTQSAQPSYATQQVGSMPPAGTAGSPGIVVPTRDVPDTKSADEALMDVLMEREPKYAKDASGLDVWEREAAEREGRAPRMANLWGEEYDQAMRNNIGNTAANDAYVRNAIESGDLSEQDAYDIMHRRDKSFWQMLSDKWSQPLFGSETDNRTSTGDITAMDDGSVYDYDHMIADKMTGAQYLKYAEMGMGGRPIQEIDPTQVYSKRREANEYDFIPFTPDETAYANLLASNVLDLPSRLGSMVANWRQSDLPIVGTPDYRIDYGKDGSVSGRDFDDRADAYLNQFQYYKRFDPMRFLSRPGDDSAYTAHVREYAVPDVERGMTTYHYGDLANVWDEGDGTYSLEFSDGSSAKVSDGYLRTVMTPSGGISLTPESVPVEHARGQLPSDLDSLNDMDAISQLVSEYGGSPLDYAGVVYVPDMVMGDGTRMTLSDVDRIRSDKTPEDDADDPYDDDIRYEFSGGLLPGTTNKPARLGNTELFDTGESGGIRFNPDDLGNNAWDWTFGSLPISVPGIMPWLYSLSGGATALTGANPGTYDPRTDSYGLIAGNYDDRGNMVYGVENENGERDDDLSESTRYWNAAGNALVPFTEMIVGPIGEHVIPLERMFGGLPSNPTVAQVIKNELIGAAGEGIEEDLGNFFEDLMQHGWSGLFANQRLDEEGNPMYDMTGYELRDYDTPLADRVRNALDVGDLANSFAGGVTVDMLMRGIPSPLDRLLPESERSITGQLVPAVRRDLARRSTGVRQFVEPEETERRELDESYLEGFDR